MSKTKIVLLNSGEEILCKHTLKDGMHNLKKPLIIIPTGEGNIGFMGWMPYADIEKTGVNVPDSFVAFVVDPDKKLESDYASFASGIVAPPQKNTELVIPKNTVSTGVVGGPHTDQRMDGPIGLVK